MSPLAWLIVALTMRHRTRLKADAGWARRRRAKGRAHARISRALRNGEPTRQLHELTEAVTGYLCDRYGLSSTALTPSEARSVLIERGLGEALAVEISDFLEGCEAMRFAPGTAEPRTPARAADDVRGWIKRIEKSSP